MSTYDVVLQRLYSPSQFNRRMSADAVIQEHVRVVTEESERIRKSNISSRLKVPYGESSRETLDIFGTDLPDESPIFVYFSGGYWQMMSGEISAYPVDPLCNSKIVTIIVDYSRAPGVTLTDIVSQAVNAAQWILAYAKEKRSRSITLAGHSAGAHLCGMILCSPWFTQLSPEDTKLFKGVFHLSGVFALTPLLRTDVNDALGMDEEEADRNSPLSETNVKICADNLSSKNPDFETFIIVGEYDSPAFTQNGCEFAKALTAQGLKKVRFESIPKVDHFNLVEKLLAKSYVLTSMIKSHILQ